MLNDLKLIAVFSKSRSKIVCVINEEFHVIQFIPPPELGQKPSRCLFNCGRIETYVEDLIRIRINRTVQLELLAMEADHLFANQELIFGDS
jgi:hypothetical protein